MPKLKVKFVKDPNYVPVYANGAVGGVNVKREIVIHFYTEILEIPKSQSFEIDNDRIKEELIEERSPIIDAGVLSVDRIIKTGVIMSSDEAYQLYVWLGKQFDLIHEKEKSNGSSV